MIQVEGLMKYVIRNEQDQWVFLDPEDTLAEITGLVDSFIGKDISKIGY